MSVPLPEDRQTSKTDTSSVPRVAPENTKGTTGSRYEAPDHSHAAFMADEGDDLKSAYLDQAKKWLSDTHGQAVDLKTDDRWHPLVRGGKCDYRASQYQDDKDRPRLKLVVHNHKTGDNDTFDDYGEVFEPSYREWLERRRELTAEERRRFNEERAARRAAEQKRAAEQERKQRRAAAKTAWVEKKRAENIRDAIEAFKILATTGTSAYLARKLGDSDVPGTRFSNGEIQYALTDPATKETVGIQSIANDGKKHTEWGSQPKGAGVFLTGLPPKNYDGRIRVAEGVVTAETGRRVKPDACYVAALSAGNIRTLCAALQKRCPNATIELLLDHDWQKALELDAETGELKRNTGMEVGHALAMRRGYRVFQPDFSAHQTAKGSLSDWNDLLRVAGWDEVRQQFTAREPDPEWAFKGEREKEAARLRTLFSKHDLSIVNQQYLNPSWIIRGRDNAARSSHGTGKSHGLEAFCEQNPEVSVLYVAPLTALTVERAAKNKAQGFRCYKDKDLDDVQLRRTKRLTITPDSLVRLTSDGATLPHFDVVVIDEPQHLLERLLGNMPYKQVVLGTLRRLLQRFRSRP